MAFIGTPNSGKETSDIIIVVTDAKASQFFIDNLLDGWPHSDYKGLKWKELPAGIMEVARITVTRTQ